MAAVAQEPPEIVALRLQLQIAEAQRDQAVAEAQGRAVAPVGQQPVQLNYLLPRDFEEVVSADLFPRDGVGRQGAVNPLRLDNDLAITEYSRRKSKHQVWTYRRSRIHNPADLLTKPLSRATLTHLFRILRKLAWGGESPDSTNTLRSSWRADTAAPLGTTAATSLGTSPRRIYSSISIY
ncbi:hypothetical protein NFJ02_32g81850 [Pycnococcus provasolii]